MDIGSYIAASGFISNQKIVPTIAHNMANAPTIGFKAALSSREAVPFSPQDAGPQGDTPLAFVRLLPPMASRIQGPMEQTGRSLDLALHGENAYFRIKTPQGSMPTRDGHFQVSPDGILMSQTGSPVQDEKGNEIHLGDAKDLRGQGKDVRFLEDGSIVVNNRTVGRLMITNKAGGPLKEDDYQIWQGYLEGSNVSAVKEMVKLLEVLRSNQTFSKLIQGYDEIEQKTINEVGRV